jgi:zinc transporter ZupT
LADRQCLVTAVLCSVAAVVGTVSDATSVGEGTIDGTDFIAFINAFAIGC